VSGYTPARKTAARAQRKTNVGRVIARGMASLGSAKARRAAATARRVTARSGKATGPAKASADHGGSDLPAGDLRVSDLRAGDLRPGDKRPGDRRAGDRRAGEAQAARAYVAREHLRKDIGSRVLVLDLTAPDAPRDAPAPGRAAQGAAELYAADCVTHHEQKFFAAYATACRAAKASHQWCPGCKRDLARHHRLHSKANAQSNPRR
jgi:hypothetical protein